MKPQGPIQSDRYRHDRERVPTAKSSTAYKDRLPRELPAPCCGNTPYMIGMSCARYAPRQKMSQMAINLMSEPSRTRLLTMVVSRANRRLRMERHRFRAHAYSQYTAFERRLSLASAPKFWSAPIRLLRWRRATVGRTAQPQRRVVTRVFLPCTCQ